MGLDRVDTGSAARNGRPDTRGFAVFRAATRGTRICEPASQTAERPASWTARRGSATRGAFFGGAVVHLVTGAIVVVGLAAGLQGLVPARRSFIGPQRVPVFGNAYVDALSMWDGQWYLKIATRGYEYDPHEQSNVAFFPAFPVLVALLHEATSLPFHIAGLAVSHGFLIGGWCCWACMPGGEVARSGDRPQRRLPSPPAPLPQAGEGSSRWPAAHGSSCTRSSRWPCFPPASSCGWCTPNRSSCFSYS